MKAKKLPIVILTSVLVVFIMAVFIFFRGPKFQIPFAINIKQKKCDSLNLKKDEKNNIATILCVKGGQETKIVDLTDMYINHYHGYEIVNGNLYVIRRIGYSGYTDETWIDELWRYQTNLDSKKLYSDKGLDFRVSEDEKMLVIYTNDYLKILDSKGIINKIFSASEVIANPEHNPMFGFHEWAPNFIWFENTLGPSLSGLIKIDKKTFAVTKYDLIGLSAGPEFVVNIYKDMVAFSNFPPIFDIDSAEKFKGSGSKVNLVVYDLNKKTQKIVATSIAKRLNPVWLDENTLEFDDPNGTGRTSVEVN